MPCSGYDYRIFRIFRTIEASVLYVIFHFHLCFLKKSWHIHRTTGGPSYPQIAKGNSLFLHAVRAVSPTTSQTDSGTFGKRILRQLRIKYHTFLWDHTIRCITGNRQCKLLQKHGKVRQLQQAAYWGF